MFYDSRTESLLDAVFARQLVAALAVLLEEFATTAQAAAVTR